MEQNKKRTHSNSAENADDKYEETKKKIKMLQERVEAGNALITQKKSEIEEIKNQQAFENLVGLFLSFMVCVFQNSRNNAILSVPLYNWCCIPLLLTIDEHFEIDSLGMIGIPAKNNETSVFSFKNRLNELVSDEDMDRLRKKIVIRVHPCNSVFVDTEKKRVTATLPHKGVKNTVFGIHKDKLDTTTCKEENYFRDLYPPTFGWDTSSQRVLLVSGSLKKE